MSWISVNECSKEKLKKSIKSQIADFQQTLSPERKALFVQEYAFIPYLIFVETLKTCHKNNHLSLHVWCFQLSPIYQRLVPFITLPIYYVFVILPFHCFFHSVQLMGYNMLLACFYLALTLVHLLKY